MAQTLLNSAYVHVLQNEKARREIIDAMNNFGPARYRTKPLSYSATVKQLTFLNREEVIDALHKVYRAWGTVAARGIAQELEHAPVFIGVREG